MKLRVQDIDGNVFTIPASAYGTFIGGNVSSYESNGTMFPDSFWQSPRPYGDARMYTMRDLNTYREALCLFYSKTPRPGTHGGDGVFRNYIPNKTNENNWYGPAVGTSFWGTYSNSPDRRVTPTSSCQQCDNISKYGLDISRMTFTFAEEASQYLRSSGVDKFSAVEGYIFQILLSGKINANTDPSKSFRIVCTNSYIQQYECQITQVTYETIPGYNTFIAKYYFPNGFNGLKSPDNYFYVTALGRLCFITTANTPIVDPPVILPPPPDIITPDTPIIGAGSVYAPILEQFSDIEYSTKPLWPNESTILIDKHIEVDDTLNSTLDLDQLSYGFDVYSHLKDDKCKKKLFRVLYGDYEGLGMLSLGGDGKTLTKAVYSQYAHKLLADPTLKFVINSAPQNHVYIIDIERSLYKNWLDAGNWQLDICNVLDSTTGYNTGATFDSTNFTIDTGETPVSVIDNNVLDKNPNEFKDSYPIYRGSLTEGVTNSMTQIGIVYPKHGVIIISGDVLDNSFFPELAPKRFDYNCFNAYRFYKAISYNVFSEAEDFNNDEGNRAGFKARYIDFNYVKYVYVRLKNTHMNFSNNPTYVINEEGTLIPEMKGKSLTYPTAIGLYNVNKELLAVGKFSKPILKNFSEEAMLTIKIMQ